MHTLGLAAGLLALTGCSYDWSLQKHADAGFEADVGAKADGQADGAGDEATSAVPPSDDAGDEMSDDAVVREVPRAPNVATLGAFSTAGEPRSTLSVAGSTTLVLYDDGFEVGPTVVDSSGRQLTGAIVP